jgi:diguanylate cyclase (GGDEF)-like protein/PAS domain S-box-containing protein
MLPNRRSPVLAERVGWLQVAGALLLVAAVQVAPTAGFDARLPIVWFLIVAAPTAWLLARSARASTMPVTHRDAWRWLAAAATVWFIGDLLWTVETLVRGRPPAVGAADLAFLLFYPVAMQALASFPGLGVSQGDRWRIQLDAFITALTIVAAAVWLRMLPFDGQGIGTWVVQLIHVVNPVGDLMLLLAVLVLRSRQTESRRTGSLRLITVALVVKLAADLIHARPVADTTPLLSALTGLGWLLFYAALSMAAAHRHGHATFSSVDDIRRHPLGWLPYASVAIAGALSMHAVFRGDLVAARGMAVITFILSLSVLLRQALVALDVRRRDKLAAVDAAESRLAALVRHSHDLVMVVDADGCVRYVSPSVERVLGLSADTLHGKNGYSLLHPDDAEMARRALDRVLAEREHTERYVSRVQHGGGGWRFIEMVVTNRLDTESINGIVLNLRDVTERRELEERLEWQAFHDPLTGLANRVLFSDRVSHALARRERTGNDFGVLFIDLDRFKLVNDTLGHHAGDILLHEAAQRICAEVRSSDTVARLGGDEFAVLLEDASVAQCRTTAERLLVQLGRGFMVDGQEVFTGASIGLAMAESSTTLDTIVRDADVAMYVAKSEGRGRVVTFERSMREHVTERLTLEADLRRALERNELSVVYQPQVDLRTGEILGAEALVRWNHPTRGLIPPARFVPIAEQGGLMVAMSRFVLRTATCDAARWRQPGSDPQTVHVAVNLSGRHLQDESLLADVHMALEAADLDPSRLTIEITESVMMHNTRDALAVLRRLKELGCKIAVDDFGTGYSSLSYLQQFPVDVLKIDKRFIDTLGSPEGDFALTRAIVSLGDALGLATVAEGIETPRQLAELRRMGCLLGQGYLLAHPLPTRVFGELLASGVVQQTMAQFDDASYGRRVA